jgi:hypothetical protein
MVKARSAAADWAVEGKRKAMQKQSRYWLGCVKKLTVSAVIVVAACATSLEVSASCARGLSVSLTACGGALVEPRQTADRMSSWDGLQRHATAVKPVRRFAEGEAMFLAAHFPLVTLQRTQEGGAGVTPLKLAVSGEEGRPPGATRAGSLPDSYLLRVVLALRLCQADIARMKDAADAAATRLSAGGQFLAGGNPSLVSEVSGRAGGLMLIKGLGGKTPDKGDVVLYFPEGDGEIPQAVLDSGALIIAFGSKVSGRGVISFSGHAEEAGISPTLASAIPGWLFTGELIAAATRLGKMPVIYESIGLYGGNPRINQYQAKGIFWHEEHTVPPTAPGVMGNGFVKAISAMLRRVEAEEREKISRAAAWASEAKRAGKRLIMYSMGHIFPAEVAQTAIGQLFESAVWNSGFSSFKPPDDKYARGDVLIHIGYQHPPTPMLERARRAGARVAYVDILQDRDYVKDENVIWIDPMWPWTDACVPIENYDVPTLASSGVVNGAIAWEIYRLTREALDKP